MTTAPPLDWIFYGPGRASYRAVWDVQERLRAAVIAGDARAERLIFVEHDPVITLGRGAAAANVLIPEPELARRGVEVVRTNRGGDVTVHGPGQLVIYPVVRLHKGIVAHVEGIGRAIADVLVELGVVGAAWRRQPAGVWVGRTLPAKIAACGVHVSRRVAIHGFAINVTREAQGLFDLIVPCGLAGSRVTNIADELRGGAPPSLPALAEKLAPKLAAALGRTARAMPLAAHEAHLVSCERMPAR